MRVGRDLGLVWFKKNGHSSLITRYSSPIIYQSSLITHHSKYPQFPTHLFGTYYQFLITQFFLLFVEPIPEHYVINSVSLPAFPLTLFISFSSTFSHHCLVTLTEAILFLFHFSCTHINKNNPIPNLRPNHHKHTNTNEYKHKLIGTHRCSNQNPQIPKSKITNTDLMPKSNPNPNHKSEPITATHISDLNPPQPHHKSEPHTHPHSCLKNQNPITTSQIRTPHP